LRVEGLRVYGVGSALGYDIAVARVHAHTRVRFRVWGVSYTHP